MPSILITGSNGLIGKTLCNSLANSSYEIKPLDSNLPPKHPGHGDINAMPNWQKKLEDCIGIVHLAAVSRVIWGEQKPAQCWQTNVNSTLQILEAAYQAPHKPWIIYASSREVYGQQQHFPVTESAVLQPLNIYARSKVAAENLVEQYRARGLQTAVLRFSSVYGRTDDHADRVVPAFCKAAASGRPIRIEGFTNTFDFTHVSDVVDGIIKTIEQLQGGNSLPPIHLTTGKPTTLYALAEMACSASKKSSALNAAPPRNFDVARFYGDPGLACKKLNWSPKIDIETGIKQLVNAFLEIDYYNTMHKQH